MTRINSFNDSYWIESDDYYFLEPNYMPQNNYAHQKQLTKRSHKGQQVLVGQYFNKGSQLQDKETKKSGKLRYVLPETVFTR